MPNSNEPSCCWRTALLTFGVLAGLILLAFLVMADGTAVALVEPATLQ